MPTDEDSGWVEPDIIVNGVALSFVECMAVRVAIGSFRIALTAPRFRQGLGDSLAAGYDRHLANVEQMMLQKAAAVHFLSQGRTLCGMTGPPSTWPDGHAWVSGRNDQHAVTCPGCRAALSRSANAVREDAQ
jgi:hypothetical protein